MIIMDGIDLDEERENTRRRNEEYERGFKNTKYGVERVQRPKPGNKSYESEDSDDEKDWWDYL